MPSSNRPHSAVDILLEQAIVDHRRTYEPVTMLEIRRYRRRRNTLENAQAAFWPESGSPWTSPKYRLAKSAAAYFWSVLCFGLQASPFNLLIQASFYKMYGVGCHSNILLLLCFCISITRSPWVLG